MGKGWVRRAAAAICVAAASCALAAPAQAGDPGDDAWAQRALELQYELGGDVGLANAPWVGTHNSYNSRAEMGPTLSNTDSNQQITIVDQLELGMRSLEIDVHLFPDPESLGYAPVVCHARGQDQAHFGCSIEKTLGPVLDGVADWLREPANRDQVLLLYLENHLDNEDGYDQGAAIVEDELGDLLYRPPAGGGCTELPYELTREEILAEDAQVIIVSGCGVGSAWPAVVHKWAQHVESRPFDYTDFPECGAEYTAAQYDELLVRYYEDSTQLTATAGTPDDGITPPTAAQMARCGVDLIGLDQVVPGDDRLPALVWSWAPGQPGRGGCALQRIDPDVQRVRWDSRRCKLRRPVACRDGEAWVVVRRPASRRHRGIRAANAQRACRRRVGGVHAAPRTGREAQHLRAAMLDAGVRRTWLGLRRDGSDWRPLDSR